MGFGQIAPNGGRSRARNESSHRLHPPFYERLFGWSHKTSEGTEDAPPWEMSPMVPAEVPSYWQVYFNVDDVDRAFQQAVEAGASEMVEPQDFPGGRFTILSDPQGASFGLLKTVPR